MKKNDAKLRFLDFTMPIIWLVGSIAYFRFSRRESSKVDAADAGDSGDDSGADSAEVGTTPKSSFFVKIVNLFGALAAVGSVLRFFAAFHWIPDILSQLTVQFLALLIPVAILAWSRKRIWLCVFLVLLMSGHLVKIVPYYLPPADGIESRVEVANYRLAVFNVLRTNE